MIVLRKCGQTDVMLLDDCKSFGISNHRELIFKLECFLWAYQESNVEDYAQLGRLYIGVINKGFRHSDPQKQPNIFRVQYEAGGRSNQICKERDTMTKNEHLVRDENGYTLSD